MKPAHIIRFEKLLAKGRLVYILSTAMLVAVLITFIQYLGDRAISWQGVGLYAFMGAVIAQIDWLILAKRYEAFNNPPDVNRKK
ncbi:hypothetical protein [Hydromonas duriensis]|uniref:Uncharacterized protein n=1 Tax=Hydromonas duriensis TaxID=1527608 RepID=A0A4R6YAK4_9BURK|nr:hypothetical protein [Hydromonas duriensis]TDR32534.1 hypothetical protein DFR44_10347 [Hydromonas duriensis]